MHFLSNLEQRWLLIIDNADTLGNKLEKYFPKGSRGHVLVTTRNPAHRIHGESFEFQGLSAQEANNLLFKAAKIKAPWDPHMPSVESITKALGFLALAITHAGAAIREGLCRLNDYLGYHSRMFTRLREKRERRQSIARLGKDEEHNSIYSCFEISLEGIAHKDTVTAKDAIQLLQVFAFFNFEDIRFEILSKAVNNFALETEQAAKDKEQEQLDSHNSRVHVWVRWMKELGLDFLQSLIIGPPPMPDAIRDGRRSGYFDEDRFRSALNELTQMSLITRNELSENDRYSMHPLVHEWARERMELSEQGLWSEAAAITLSQSILLPPLGDTSEEEEFRSAVLPHVDHILQCQTSIRDRVTRKRKLDRKPTLTDAKWSLTRDRAMVYAKFSFVYFHCGRHREAEALQVAVKDFVLKMRGPHHPISRRIMLFLAATYWYLGRGDEAEQLQNAVLGSCMKLLGPDHQNTLQAKSTLAETFYLQGRYSHAKELLEEVVYGFTKRFGGNHVDTLHAKDRLGLAITKLWQEFDEAQKFHLEAFFGFQDQLGSDHMLTLQAKENLAVVATHIGDKHTLTSALELIDEVLLLRKKKLGKEHPNTLLTMLNKARIETELGHLTEAEELLRSGLLVADRNLGHDHVGTLIGRYYLSIVLIRGQRYVEAESILLNIIERQKDKYSYRGKHHPDRLGSMMQLFFCYKGMGKIEKSLEVSSEALDGFEKIDATDHPLAQLIRRERDELLVSWNIAYENG
jgi:tetratricopeptide (TPR) repeat protein